MHTAREGRYLGRSDDARFTLRNCSRPAVSCKYQPRRESSVSDIGSFVCVPAKSNETMAYKVINSALLIEEVKKHPVLYDNKLANGNTEQKRQSWEEVAMTLFGERWMNFGGPEREALVKEIQVKWKSLRDNFTRILRKEREEEIAGTTTKNRKRYLYFDHLLFLVPYTTTRKPQNVFNFEDKDSNGSLEETKPVRRSISNIIYLDESKESNESTQFTATMEENPLQTTAQSTAIGTMQPVQFIQIQPNQTLPTMSKTQIGQAAEEDEASVSASNRRIAKVLEDVVALQKEEKTDDTMGNKKFLLSLLPFMRKLPDDVNLEVRLQLMSVLQTYNSNSKGFL